MSTELILVLVGLCLWFLVGVALFVFGKDSTSRFEAVLIMLIPCGVLSLGALAVIVDRESRTEKDQIAVETKIAETVTVCREYIEKYQKSE